MSFLFEGFILEAKEDALAFLKQKYGSEMEPSIIDYFFQNDPTSDKKYTKWLIENYIFDKDKIKPDGQMTVPEYMIEKVVLFNNLRRNLPQQLNDFKKFSFIDLISKIAEFYKSKREIELPQEAKDGAKLIWQNNNFELYNITNKAASCHYGKGTKWCISRQDEDHFQTYSDSGCVFFFLIFKNKVIAGENYKHAIVISTKGEEPSILPGGILEWRNPEQTSQYSYSELSPVEKQEVIEAIKSTGIKLAIGEEHVEGEFTEFPYGIKTEIRKELFYNNGILSRTDGPALITFDKDGSISSQCWYVDGTLHRTDGPAEIYYEKGKLSSKRWWFEGKSHNLNGPAVVYYNEDGSIFRKIYYVDGNPHNSYGPAETYYFPPDRQDIWYINGKRQTEKQFKIWQQKNNILEKTDDTIFEIKKQNLNESFLAMFGSIIELAIKRMFGFDIPNISFKGHPTDVQRLAKTLASEKRYIDSYLNNKLNSPEVIQNKFRLEKAIYDFERETGIPWPIR